MLELPAVVVRQAGWISLWGTAPPFSLEALAGSLSRWGEEILRVGPMEVVFAFPEWTRPRRVIPQSAITERGLRIRAPWTTFWLVRFGYEEPRADLEGLTLEGEPVQLWVRDLDLDAAEAYLAVSGWLRCTAGVWVQAGTSPTVQADVEAAAWAAAWLRVLLPPPACEAFEGILDEAARRGIPWAVLYREREARFDPEIRRRVEGMLLLARALRRYRVEIPSPEALAEIPFELP